MKAHHVVNLVLLVLLIIGSLTVWNRVPDRVPMHFDLAGNPDKWGGVRPGGLYQSRLHS